MTQKGRWLVTGRVEDYKHKRQTVEVVAETLNEATTLGLEWLNHRCRSSVEILGVSWEGEVITE